jgi:hypothetical protein
MDDFQLEALSRLPLAEAALRVWRFITNEPFLEEVFARYRGRSYEKELSFGTMVHLIAEALLHYGGSGRRSIEEARGQELIDTSIAAAFGKLRRIPITLSTGFLRECSQRLTQLFPESVAAVELPPSLKELEAIVLDGKALKRVAKRLQALQKIKGGVLGGRALVGMRLRTGLIVGMHAHPDGHVNDVRFVPDLLPRLREVVPGPRIFIGDRQFCNLQHLELYLHEEGDHFLIRYHKNVTFTPDATRPAKEGKDAKGRTYCEEWGWLGRADHPKRRRVRRITLARPGEEPILIITDLLDEKQYPAADLLDLYLRRWGIERVFQQVTEVFGLEGFIGSTPEATVFQFSFCTVLYNIVQVLRAYVAEGSSVGIADISTEKMFLDVRNQLLAWNELNTPAETAAAILPQTVKQTRQRLRQLLGTAWRDIWRKAPKQRRQPREHSGKRCHQSIFRVLQGVKSKRRGTNRS